MLSKSELETILKGCPVTASAYILEAWGKSQNGLLFRLEKELKIKNYSNNTIKAYLYSIKKFLDYSSIKTTQRYTQIS